MIMERCMNTAVDDKTRLASYKPHIKKDPNPKRGSGLFSRLGLPPRGVELYAKLHKGFDFQVYTNLSKYLQIQQKEFNIILKFAPATVERRKTDGFNLGESDSLYRLAEISSAAIELFEGDEDKARSWLNKPVKGLGNKRPVDMAITSAETEATIDLIGRLEYGVFS